MRRSSPWKSAIAARNDKKALIAHFNAIANYPSPESFLKTIKCPTLVISGSDDPIVTPQDARQLAIKMNLDPDSWDSLAETLPLLRFRKYYKNSKYGYCRGTEPVLYIKQIMIYYDILKRHGIKHGEVQAKFRTADLS